MGRDRPCSFCGCDRRAPTPLTTILEGLEPDAQAAIGALLADADQEVVGESFAAIEASGSYERLAGLRNDA